MREKIGKSLCRDILCAILVMFFVSGTVLFFNPGQVMAEKVITLKVAHFIKEVHPMCRGLKWWGDEVTKRTGGKVQFKYFWASSLAGPPQLYDAIRTGLADMGPILPVLHAAKTPIFTIGAMPGMPTNKFLNAVWAAHQLGKTDAAQAEVKRNGFHFLYGNGHSGDFIFSSKQIKRLEDLKKMRISSFGPFGAAFKIWGSDVTWLGVAETYEGLKRGVVDGANKPLVAGITEALYEVAPYVMLPQIGINVTAVTVMREKTWNKMSPDIQKVMNEVSEEMSYKLAELFDKFDPIFIKQMKGKGMTFTSLPEGDVSKMRQSVKGIWNKWAADMDKKGLPGTELKDKFYNWCAEGPK